MKFEGEVPNHDLEPSDFAYPLMTKKMTTVLKIVFQETDFCRTEIFIQKHFLGLNLAALHMICEIKKIIGPEYP